MKIIMGLLLVGILAGCMMPAVMTEADWTRLEGDLDKKGWSEEEKEAFKTDLEERTMSPEEFEAWKVETALGLKKAVLGVVPLPGPVKEPLDDITDFLMKLAMFGGAGVGAVGAVKGGKKVLGSMRNSPPGKIFTGSTKNAG